MTIDNSGHHVLPLGVNHSRAFRSFQVCTHGRNLSIANQDGTVLDVSVRDGEQCGVLNQNRVVSPRARDLRTDTNRSYRREQRYCSQHPESHRATSAREALLFARGPGPSSFLPSPGSSAGASSWISNQRPSTKTCFTFVFSLKRSPSVTVKFAIFPGAILPVRSSTPSIAAASTVNARKAKSAVSPASIAFLAFLKISFGPDKPPE